MLDRLKSFAQKMRLKLEDKSYMDELKKNIKKQDANLEHDFKHNLAILKRPLDTEWLAINFEEIKKHVELVQQKNFGYYLELLGIACIYNLRDELVELIGAFSLFEHDFRLDKEPESKALIVLGNIYDSFDYKKPFIDRPLKIWRGGCFEGFNDTLLTLTAFHGHLNLVKYLVEEQKADVNAINFKNETPLLKTVQGDSYPENHQSYGIQHAEVAQYLIEHNAEIGSALTTARRAKPPTFFTNPVREHYLADRVRPVLERAQRQRSLEHNSCPIL